MNRHIHRRGAAGFSMVELLVTIIIAGIAFAAMVPLFVQAQEAQSTDRSRNIAINIAQEKIEQVRYLPWNLLLPTATPPTPPAVSVGVQLGTTAVRGGKTYTIVYDVIDSTGTTSFTAYREVMVRVTWQNMGSAKAVEAKTIVYKQFAGPQIVNLTVDPPPNDTLHDWITDARTTLLIRATISTTQGVAVGGVQISIMDASGAYTFDSVQATKKSADTYEYSWPLTKPAVLPTQPLDDGFYIITATAYSAASGVDPGTPGPSRMLPVRLERNPPPRVEFPTLWAYAGDHKALLTWTLQASGVDHYEIYRDVTTGSEPDEPIAEVEGSAQAFWDTRLTNDTPYYYRVVAVDTNGNKLAWTNSNPDLVPWEKTITPMAPTSSTPPGGLSITSLVGSNNAEITWGAAASTAGYLVYRQLFSSSPIGDVQLIQFVPTATEITSVTWNNLSLAWNSTYLYTVRALGANGVESDAASLADGMPPGTVGSETWVLHQTPTTPLYTVNAQVMGKKVEHVTVTAWLLDSSGVPTTTTQAVTDYLGIAAFTGSTSLPYGDYKITTSASSSKLFIRLTGDPSRIVTLYVY